MNTKDLVYIALFVAVYAVLNFFSPIYLPFLLGYYVAQSMGPMLAGSYSEKKGRLWHCSLSLFLPIVLPLCLGGGDKCLFRDCKRLFDRFFAFFIGLMVELFWQRLNFITFFVINIVGGIGVFYAFRFHGQHI